MSETLATDAERLADVLEPIIRQALGMKSYADHAVVVRLTAEEINAGKEALVEAGRWSFRLWEDRP